MNKTDRRGRGVTSQRAAAAGRRGRRRRGRHLPAVPRAAARWSTPPAARASRSTRRTCTRPTPARSPARCRRAMLAELDVARRGARPLRAPPVLQRDRPGAPAQGAEGARDRARRRSSASARPRTSASAARPSASCATRSRRALEKVAAERLPRSSSPTSRSGRSAPARSRRPSRRRRRARSCARSSRASTRPRPSRCASSTAARSSPTTRRSCWRCPTSTARWSAARASSPSRLRAIVGGARRQGTMTAVRPASASIVLDGWGLAPDGPGNAVSLADTPVFDELWARAPAHDADREGRGRRPARRARWATPRSATSTSAPARSCRRTSRASTTRSRTARWPRTRRCATRLRRRRARAPDRAGLRRRRALLRPAPEGADRARRRAQASPDLVVHAFTDGRDTSPTPAPASLASVEELAARRAPGAIGIGHRPLLRDGPRQALGPRRRRRYDLLVHGEGEHHADTGEEAVKAAYERDETDEFITPTTVGEEARIRARRLRDRASTSAPTACARSLALDGVRDRPRRRDRRRATRR